MRTLLAIVNARHRHEWRNVIRSTWLSQVPNDKADAFFFVGRGESFDDTANVVELDCSDRYEHLPEKIRAIARWALSKGYDYVLKIDDDVMVRPNALLDSGYQVHEYSGRSNRPDSPYAIPCGFCYMMSRKCLGIIANSELPADGSNDDERWCAYNLSQNGIYLQNEKRYFLHQTRVAPADVVPRPIRAPKRIVIDTFFLGPQPEPGTFAWCVHLCCELEEKLRSFNVLFGMYGEK